MGLKGSRCRKVVTVPSSPTLPHVSIDGDTMKMTMLHVPNRNSIFTCYLDESGTDNNCDVAVVGGLIFDVGQLFWLGLELPRVLSRHKIIPPLHMCEFGKGQKLGHLNSESRRALFEDVVRVINDNKTMSIASTLSSEDYHRAFDEITELSMYGASFLQVAMLNDTAMKQGGFKGSIKYLLDAGNPYRSDVEEAEKLLSGCQGDDRFNLVNVGFESDDDNFALQAADVVSWSVRRRLSSGLKSGFEPLEGILAYRHEELAYKEEWMVGVAERIRAKGTEPKAR
jgi:hypothetical protein